jgi:hypothetical protein
MTKKSDTRWMSKDYIEQGLATEIDEILTKGRFPRKKAIKDAILPITEGWVDWLNENLKSFFGSFQNNLIHSMEEGMGGGVPQVIQPPNTLIIAGKYEYCCLVIVEPPHERTILVTAPASSRLFNSGRIKLPFPFMVYMMTFNKGLYDHLHVAVRTRPLTSLSDKLHLSGLPNIGPRYDMAHQNEAGQSIPVFRNKKDWPFGVCLGDAQNRLIGQCRNKPLAEQSELILGEFWQTRWQGSEDGVRPDHFSWSKWANMGSLEILDQPFPESMSLQNALEYLLPKEMEVNAKGVHKELEKMYSTSFSSSWKKLKADGNLMEDATKDVSEMLENTLHFIARRVANKLQEVPDEKVRQEAVKAFLTALQEAVK